MWTTVLIVIALAALAGALVWLSVRLRRSPREGAIDPLQRRRGPTRASRTKRRTPHGSGPDVRPVGRRLAVADHARMGSWPRTRSTSAPSRTRGADRCPPIRPRQLVGRRATEPGDENTYLRDATDWDDYAAWHLGLTDGATDETKARYAFVFGDFRRIHRWGSSPASTGRPSGATRRSSSAAHDLLQHLDSTRASWFSRGSYSWPSGARKWR